MKQFTVKDFISYNNPCFSCGEQISFRIIADTMDIDVVGTTNLRPTVSSEYTVVDLKLTYENTLQLWIFHQSNKIITSDSKALTNYLRDHKLRLKSRCEKCYTNIESNNLEFNLEKSFIKPVELQLETLMLDDNSNRYQINSYFHSKQSTIAVDRIDKATPVSPVRLTVPILPLYHFKDKEHIINKMKTYLIFS
jgi:hypothetical protein